MAGSRPWGWHRLKPDAAKQLVELAPVGVGSLVLDVGAGWGAITEPLLAAGTRVIAVEAHPGRAHQLRQIYGDRVVIVQADAADLRLPKRPYHLVANPPFGITNALLRRILQPGSRLVSARLILQEQAARRWAGPTAPAVARWGRHYSVRLGPRFSRGRFTPPPRVDTRVLMIDRC